MNPSEFSQALDSQAESGLNKYLPKNPRPIPCLMALPAQEHKENRPPIQLHQSQNFELPSQSAREGFTQQTGFNRLTRSTSYCEPARCTEEPRIEPLPLLPHIPNPSTCLTSINPSTLAELLNGGTLSLQYDRILVIDARYPYEYEGGHIKDAINVYLPQQADDVRDELLTCKLGPRICVIIHCEFSSQRGPKLFKHIRSLDRKMNVWPQMCVPEMYILHGGYKLFYQKYPHLCTPNDYVPMDHPDFSSDLETAKRLTHSQGSIKRSKRSSCNKLAPFPLAKNEPGYSRSQSTGRIEGRGKQDSDWTPAPLFGTQSSSQTEAQEDSMDVDHPLMESDRFLKRYSTCASLPTGRRSGNGFVTTIYQRSTPALPSYYDEEQDMDSDDEHEKEKRRFDRSAPLSARARLTGICPPKF